MTPIVEITAFAQQHIEIQKQMIHSTATNKLNPLMPKRCCCTSIYFSFQETNVASS